MTRTDRTAVLFALTALLLALAACASLPRGVASELANLAGEVCIESDAVAVCARKCASEARRRAEAEDADGGQGGAPP